MKKRRIKSIDELTLEEQLARMTEQRNRLALLVHDMTIMDYHTKEDVAELSNPRVSCKGRKLTITLPDVPRRDPALAEKRFNEMQAIMGAIYALEGCCPWNEEGWSPSDEVFT